MTLRTNARVAGVTLLVYFAAGIGELIAWFMWLPLLVFELTLAAWFLVKGVDAPPRKLAA